MPNDVIRHHHGPSSAMPSLAYGVHCTENRSTEPRPDFTLFQLGRNQFQGIRLSSSKRMSYHERAL